MASETDNPGKTPLYRHTGIVIEANSNFGIGFLRDDTSHMNVPFVFDLIEGYAGQTMREIGFLPGRTVTLMVDSRQRLQSISFPFEDRYRRIFGLKISFQDFFDGF